MFPKSASFAEFFKLSNKVFETLSFSLLSCKEFIPEERYVFLRGAMTIKLLQNNTEIHFTGVIVKSKRIVFFPFSESNAC